MAYNPDKDKSAGYISPYHNELLQGILVKTKPPVTKRALLEHLIEKEAKGENNNG